MRHPHPGLNIVELSSLEALPAEQWDELWQHSPDATVFQSRHWLQAWVEVFGTPDNPLKLLAAYAGSQLVGLVPLVRDGREGQWKIVADDYSDYQTFLARDDSPQVLEALLVAADECLPTGETVLLHDVPRFSALAVLLGRASDGHVSSLRGVRAGNAIACPTLRVRANTPGVTRVLAKTSLRRHERALAKHGELSVVHVDEASQIAPLLPGLFAQHIARWEKTEHPSLFLNPLNQRFYEVLTNRMPQGGLLFTHVRVGEHIAAQHFGLRSRNSLLWYKPSFDIALRAVSPGEVLLKRLVEYTADNSLDELDFTRGDEPFKWRFASTVSFNRHFTWHRSLSSQMLALGKSALRSIRPAQRPTPTDLGGSGVASKNFRAVLLDTDAGEGIASHLEKALQPCGVEVHHSTVESLLGVTDPAHYSLIVPCSRQAFEAIEALPEDDPRRVGAVLPSKESLRAAATITSEAGSCEDRSSILCVCAHGKLVWCFPDNSELIGLAKRVLGDLQWHGFARLWAEPASDGSWRLVGVSAQLDTLTEQAGAELPQTLWYLARGEAVKP